MASALLAACCVLAWASDLRSRYCAGDRELILLRIENVMGALQRVMREAEGEVRSRFLPALSRFARRTELWKTFLELRAEVAREVGAAAGDLSPTRLAPLLERAARARQAFLEVDFQLSTRSLVVPVVVTASVCRVIQRRDATVCAAIGAWDPELSEQCRAPVIDIGGYARFCAPASRMLLEHTARLFEASCRSILAEAALLCSLDLLTPRDRLTESCDAFTRDQESACPDPARDPDRAMECRAPLLTRRLFEGRLSYPEYEKQVRLDATYLLALRVSARTGGDCRRAALEVFDEEARLFFETWP